MAKQDLRRNSINIPVAPQPFTKKQLPIGMRLYLFQDTSGNNHKLANECLISARAKVIDRLMMANEINEYRRRHWNSMPQDDELSWPPTFLVPDNVVLRFYNTPGSEPDDGASIRRFHDNNQYSSERFNDVGGKARCQNFLLSKYQVTSSPIAKINYNPHDLTAKSYPLESYDSLTEYPYDVVTVRNRLLLGGITLQDLIDVMMGAHANFRVYHCLFSS